MYNVVMCFILLVSLLACIFFGDEDMILTWVIFLMAILLFFFAD